MPGKGHSHFSNNPFGGGGGAAGAGGNHSEKDIAKFGDRPDIYLVQKFKSPFQFWLPTGTCQV